MSRILKAIIFDMDGVITMTMPYHFRAWAKAFAEEGVFVSKFEIYSREGQKGINSIIEIFKKHNKPITLKKANEILLRKELFLKALSKTPFVPGSRSFIRKYYRRGLKLALVTGTATGEVDKILPLTLIKCFNVVISGSDVRYGKPHPQPYQMAIKALKVDREEAIVIENAPFGITSAIKAGLTCVAIETSLPRAYLKDAASIIQNYRQLESYINRHYLL